VEQFSGYRQQDAHECIIFMLQLLHNGLGVPVNPDDNTAQQLANTPDPGRNPVLSWIQFLKHEKNSNILRWFYGQYESVKKCMNCNTVFPMYDAWNCLSLEIPLALMKPEYTLDDLLTAHIEPEELSDKYDCEKCKQPCSAMSQHTIWKCPPILILQMKRFRNNGGKIAAPIDFPFELDLKKYVSRGNTLQSTMYDLYAVIYHQGQLNGGHYYASCKVNSSEWYTFNDEKQHPLPADRIVTPFAYVLFYKKRNDENESQNSPPLWNTWQ
jgi:ubiquitin C-terminal hydrolase